MEMLEITRRVISIAAWNIHNFLRSLHLFAAKTIFLIKVDLRGGLKNGKGARSF